MDKRIERPMPGDTANQAIRKKLDGSQCCRSVTSRFPTLIIAMYGALQLRLTAFQSYFDQGPGADPIGTV